MYGSLGDETMEIQTNAKKQPFKFGVVLYPLIHALLFICCVNPAYAADRFTPPTLGASLSNFEKRYQSNQLNVSFILARVLNEARLIHRAGEDIKKSVEIFRNQTEFTSGSVSNSVIIPPGTKADTIIIINQNEGDSYAIQR